MVMSTADYFRMMQGGVDRTGYADMMPDRIEKRESIEDRLAKLMAQSDEDEDKIPPLGDPDRGSNLDIDQSQAGEYTADDGTQKVFGDEFQNRDLDLLGTVADLIFDGGVFTAKNLIEGSSKRMTDEEIDDFYKGPAQDQVYGGIGFDKHRDTYDLQAGDTNIYGNKVLMDSPLYDAGSPYHDLFKADGGRVGFSVGGQSPRGGLRGGRRSGFGGTPDPGGGPGGGPDNNKNDLMGPGLDAPTIDPMKAVAYTPVKQPSLIDQVKKYNFLQGVYGDEDDGLSFGYDINPYAEEASAKLSYSFADGGRVGLQNGGQPMGSPGGAFPMGPSQPSSVYGLGSLLSGMQQSMGPTFGSNIRTADFRDSNNDGVDDRDQGMGISPSIPGNEKNPGMNIEDILASLQSGMPQAYTPYVSTMPLYDPSTLGTGLPSTAGGYDPYVSYDPYAPVGAFSRPPSNMDTPFGLTEDQIKEGFSDMDRFSLAAQEAKRKAEEEAAKKAAQKNKPKGGGGGGGGSSPDPGKNSGSNTGSNGIGGGFGGKGPGQGGSIHG